MAGPDDHLALLSKWSRRLDPSHALDPGGEGEDGELYVDLDEWSHEGQRYALRGSSTVKDIIRAIRVAGESFAGGTTHLFSGFRGTGKTTELNRLARELDALGNFTVLRVSARDYHHLSDALSIEELAVMLAGGIGEAALEALGEAQLESLKKEGVWTRIHGLLGRAFKGTDISLSFGPVQLKAALRQGEGLKVALREALRERPNELQDFLHGFIRELAATIRPRQLVVIIDDLEKYNVPTSKVAAVYQDMAQLFFHSPDILKLPHCHTIYTVPPYLAFINPSIADAYDGRLHILPSVKLRERPPDRAPFEPGLAALEGILAQRVDLDRLFGDAREACLRPLVEASGGNIRDLFVLLRDPIEAAVDDGLPVGLAQVERAIQKQAGPRRMLLKGPFEILSEVRQRGDLASIGEERLGAFAAAMDQHLLLCYWNGEFWYDVHPIVEPRLDRGREPEPSPR